MYTQILRRAGIVLVIIGALDIAYMIYCISNHISYSSSFNVFSIIAGVFLVKGNLRAASIVRWFSAFILGGLAVLLVTFQFLQPIDLTLTQIELNPIEVLIYFTFLLFISALFYWLVIELGREEVLEARKVAGRKIRNIKFAIGSGALFVMLLAVFLSKALNGESASKASAIALKEVGSDYKAHVTSINFYKNNDGTSVAGIVTVWNKNEIKNIPVSWQE